MYHVLTLSVGSLFWLCIIVEKLVFHISIISNLSLKLVRRGHHAMTLYRF